MDGKTIKTQPIHDPFIRSTVVVGISRWEHFNAILNPQPIRVQVIVDSSEGAQRAIMTLDPEQLARDTEEILRERKISRDTSATIGYCVAAH